MLDFSARRCECKNLLTSVTLLTIEDSKGRVTKAVGKLDSVFGTVRYQDVTAQNLLTEGKTVTC